MSILRKIAAGAAWMTGAQWLVQITQFAVSITLARLLVPADYGLVGMALVVTGFVALFGNLGLGAALIQRKDLDDDYVSTAFWATATAGVVLLAIVYVAAPLAATFYREPRVTLIARVAALGLLFGPMNSIVTSLLERHMRYRAVAMLDVSTSLLGQVTAVSFAVLEMGVWSLIAGTLVAQATRIPLAFVFERWTPRLGFSFAKLRDLLSFGGYLLVFNFVNYFNRNLDKLIIGRTLGAVQLGYYDMAYQAMLKPLQNLSDTIGRPLFPALASLQDDRAAAAETYLSVVTFVSLLSFPAMFGLSAVAPEFVVVVLGERWSPSIPVLQILAVVGGIQSVASMVGSVYLSHGRSDLMLSVGIGALILVAFAFFLGVQWGIVGVAACYSLASLIVWVVSQSVANRLIGLSAVKYATALAPALRSSLLMVACVLVARELAFYVGFGPLLRLVCCVLLGIIIYSALMWMEPTPSIRQVRITLVRRLRRIG